MAVDQTVMVGGLPITKTTRIGLAQAFLDDLEQTRRRPAVPKYSTSANGHVLALAAKDARFRKMIEAAAHIDADGMPLVIASRYWAADALPERIATTDFIHDVAQVSQGSEVRFFLLGAKRDINTAAVSFLRARYPWLIVEGHHGYFSQCDEPDVLKVIHTFKPDLLWVGLGVPREHEFVLRHRDQLCGVTWIKTCGGLLDFLAGQRRRAPLWLQKMGFEWLWRLAQEPARLGPRYWATNGQALRLLWQHRAP